MAFKARGRTNKDKDSKRAIRIIATDIKREGKLEEKVASTGKARIKRVKDKAREILSKVRGRPISFEDRQKIIEQAALEALRAYSLRAKTIERFADNSKKADRMLEDLSSDGLDATPELTAKVRNSV